MRPESPPPPGPFSPSFDGMSNDLSPELDFALRLADAADAVTLPRFEARNFSVDLKENLTEVTEVDRACETVIMDMVRAERPHHAWYGEEHGTGGEIGRAHV